MVRDIETCGKLGAHEEGACDPSRRGTRGLNHHRKYAALLFLTPKVFWAIGPEGGPAFDLRLDTDGRLQLLEHGLGVLVNQ
jgi:hypothetical protein